MTNNNALAWVFPEFRGMKVKGPCVLAGTMTCGSESEMFRNSPKIYNTTTMRPLYRSLQPICTPLLHPKHTNRIASTPLPSWTRSFHASATYRAVDLVYTLHDEHGKAKGAPILILHGLFGTKKNNRSVSKYASLH